MNSRGSVPRIWPPRMKEALKYELAVCPTGAELAITSFTTFPTSLAVWYMDGVSSRVGARSFTDLVRSSSMLTTDCVVARLPADIKTMTRSPGSSQTCILRKVEMESMPALVRVSDMNTSPRSIFNPTQYVMELLLAAAVCRITAPP